MVSTTLFTRSAIALAAAIALVATARADDAASESEQQLLAVLRSDAPAAEKAITCKRLAIHGSSAAVPELAKLLPNEQLSSWARIALEAIPGSAADEALRQAASSLEGKLLIGTMNSIGVRRDAGAVELLSARLADKDADVASAAAAALGQIGNAAATKSLRAALAGERRDVRSAVAEGCVLCAERLHADGKSAEAVAIYDEVRKADVPLQRVIEATRGAILARKQEGIPLLLEQLRSENKKMFQLALSTAREFPGGQLDKALADELTRASEDRAALILFAMADRPETLVLPAVLKAAEQGPQQVRLAAIRSLGRVGDASCLAAMLEVALGEDKELAEAARTALAELEGQQVDARIVAMLPEAKGKSYPLLIELVGQRRIAAVPDLLEALKHSEQDVRSAALAALGETITLERLSVLVEQAVAAQHAEDAPVARQALRAASVRMPDREACAAELALALQRAPAAAKGTLLEILADVGGAKALQTLATAAKGNDPELQDTGSRLLGKWNSVDAAPVLLDLAKTAPSTKYQIRALRGYIGLARKFAMPEPQRVAMCRQAFDLGRPAEKTLVLEVLKLRPSPEGLKLALEALQTPELKAAATEATLVIAQKVGGKGADVGRLLSKAGLGQVKLEIIKAEYGAGSTLKDVTGVIRKHASDSPLILLPSNNYNGSFGGDPVPGTPKKLKIQYRMNGKAGEATFDENALIILPTSS